MREKKKFVLVPSVAIALFFVLTLGATVAFFNYTRLGGANTVKVGRIYFNSTQNNTINLINVFPITSEEAETDTTNSQTLSINVIGDTDYDKGIEYLLTLDQVNNTVNNKHIPINLDVSVTGNGLGTKEDGDYYTNRDTYNESKYKIEYNGRLEQDRHILVGYIRPNTTKGTIEGINGTINIKAYIDSSKILISDTYPEGTTTIEGVEYYNGTPTTDKMVLTTEEWNSITGSNALSFKIKVEAREGIWVEKESTPASCFITTSPTLKYLRNPNMNISTCISKFTEWWGDEEEGETVNTGETYEAFCNGTGTNWGDTFQHLIDDNFWNSSDLTELETAGIIINLGYSTSIITYDTNCGSDVIIPSTINTELVMYTRNPNIDINACVSKLTEWGFNERVQEGETLDAFCNGTGTVNGMTLQDVLDINFWDSSDLTELETAGIIISNSTSIQANVTMIYGNSFANKGLTSVTIPNSVITIGNNAFAVNSELTALNIDMTDIPENFAYNQGISTLTNLEIGNHVITIGEHAFIDNQLTSINIPNNVTTNLCEIVAFDTNVNIIKNGQALYCPTPDRCFTTNISNNSVTITDYDASCGTDVKIPATIGGYPVTAIDEATIDTVGWTGSFANKGLTSITIPNSITSIGDASFFGNNIYDAVVPNSVLDTPWTYDAGNRYYCKYFDGGVAVTWNDTVRVCFSTENS